MSQVQKKSIEEINAAYGKIPPQAVDLEEAVLGALMIERDAYFSVSEIITDQSFYEPRHQTIYKTVQGLIKQGKPVDLLIVTQELRNRNLLDEVGGPLMITQLTSRVATAAHIEHHARIIAQTALSRQIIRICSERTIQAYDLSIDVDETLTGLQNDLIKLLETGTNREYKMVDAVREIEDRILWNQNNSGLSGIGTGLYKFDQFSSGLQKTDLVIIAGESSQGKTSLALTMMKNAVMRYKARVAMYSLEMSKAQLVARLLAQETEISSKRILNYQLTLDELSQIRMATKILTDLSVFFDECSTSSIDQICTSLRRLKIKHDINLAVVDYLQLVDSGLKYKTDEAQVAEIARRLKNVAKELNITIIALSQLSRSTNGNHKPSKSRLRGSGQIEEAADVVMLIWRPETYGIEQFDDPFKGTWTEGLAECIIEKGRNIGTGSFLLRFKKETTSFYDYTEEYSPEFLGN